MIGFTWPVGLASLLLIPLLVFGYLEFRRRRDAVPPDARALRLTDATSGRRVGRRRHVAPALFLLAISLLLVGTARPTIPLALPRLEGTVILAFDVSASMQADDLKPTRMEAAKAAAAAFVKNQPRLIKVGIVAFSDTAFVVQEPTSSHADLLAAIDRLKPQGGTSVTEGVFKSLGAIAGHPIVVPEGATPEDLLETDIGYFGSAVIVMLTDGEHTTQGEPAAVAQLAANAGVRVFTVGVGSPEGTTLTIDGFHIATALNEPLLTEIADTTNGAYFRAEDETQLAQIYNSVDLGLTTPGERVEVTSILALLAMACLVAGAFLNMRWFGRMP